VCQNCSCGRPGEDMNYQFVECLTKGGTYPLDQAASRSLQSLQERSGIIVFTVSPHCQI
jgi:hypothetical protein